MTLDKIKKIVVIGGGTMGSGIAQISAMAGFPTLLYDIDQSNLDIAFRKIERNIDGGIDRGKIHAEDKEGIMNKIESTTDILQLKGDFFIEAIIENAEIKIDLFKKLATLNYTDAIFATNTSSIPITQIASRIPNPGRVVGMHFFNPAHIMKLVEVISGASTDPEVAQTVFQLAQKMGKTAVMAKDAPGFIVNRVARLFYVESLNILEEQVADQETIDDLMKNAGFKMGPFRLMDLIGIDTNHAVTKSMYDSFFKIPKFRPSRIQQNKVDAGHWGRKTKKGFYDYE